MSKDSDTLRAAAQALREMEEAFLRDNPSARQSYYERVYPSPRTLNPAAALEVCKAALTVLGKASFCVTLRRKDVSRMGFTRKNVEHMKLKPGERPGGDTSVWPPRYGEDEVSLARFGALLFWRLKALGVTLPVSVEGYETYSNIMLTDQNSVDSLWYPLHDAVKAVIDILGRAAIETTEPTRRKAVSK